MRLAAATLIVCGLAVRADASLTLSADGLTVYDSANNITWVADGNLAAAFRFGMPVCTGAIDPKNCVNASGSMRYEAAVAWVAAMNAANYLGHSNWQLPITPATDKNCNQVGANGGGFAYGCTENALAIVYNLLGLKAPVTAVPVPANTVGPFRNFQPYLYWSRIDGGASGYHTFSFASGWRGANTTFHDMYALPMIPGKIPGTPTPTGTGLQVNPGGQSVYDPVTNVTWVVDANLAASNTFGIPACTGINIPKPCVASDGSMSLESAMQLVANMNTAGYLGQKNWQLPPVDTSCGEFGCFSSQEPMGELYYKQLGLSQGTPVTAVPNVAEGPFHNLQPYLYWSCEATTIQQNCQTSAPVANQGWSFSFGNGFTGTDIMANNLYVMPYFVGARSATAGPTIAAVANAEGESAAIAPNTWVDIKGVNLAPAGDSRIWQAADFAGGQMPTALDKVSVTVNGKSAYVYYISPSQINVLTPPDGMSGTAPVVVTNNGAVSASFTAQAQATSPSWFVFGGGPYVAAVHANGTLVGPTTLYPGATTPAKAGEVVMIYANGFGPTTVPLVNGSPTQSGTLSPGPVVQIGGVSATVQFAGLVAAGEFQFNVVVPAVGSGDQAITVTYGGVSTQAGALITVGN